MLVPKSFLSIKAKVKNSGIFKYEKFHFIVEIFRIKETFQEHNFNIKTQHFTFPTIIKLKKHFWGIILVIEFYDKTIIIEKIKCI